MCAANNLSHVHFSPAETRIDVTFKKITLKSLVYTFGDTRLLFPQKSFFGTPIEVLSL